LGGNSIIKSERHALCRLEQKTLSCHVIKSQSRSVRPCSLIHSKGKNPYSSLEGQGAIKPHVPSPPPPHVVFSGIIQPLYAASMDEMSLNETIKKVWGGGGVRGEELFIGNP
jgi:hypothetical protein